MPEPGRGTSRDEWLRELLEEYRHGTQEMASLHVNIGGLQGELENLRVDFQRLGKTMDNLAQAIRGGDGGGLGLAGVSAVLDNRTKTLESQMMDVLSNGTPHSRAALSVLQQRLNDQEADIAELKVQREASISRGWQIGFFLGSSLMSFLAVAVAVVALFVKK